MYAKTQFDKHILSILDKADTKLKKYEDKIEKEMTAILRKEYRGKKVKCECFDSWTDGDDYFFDQKLIDIRFNIGFDKKTYITVIFRYKSVYADKNARPKNTTFYLKSIESVS